MSEIKILQREIISELDLILEDFDGQFDFIEFNKEKFIPIEYETVKSFDFENTKDNSNNSLKISFENNDCLMTNLSKDDFDVKYDKFNENCLGHIEKSGISNTYISLGLIEFDDHLAPCILIPIFFEKDKNEYKIFRNFNQEIQFNGILKVILDEYDVSFPKFEGNISDFIKQIAEVDEINYYPEAYIGNFDLKFQHLLYDLNANNWDSIDEKYKLFKQNRYEFVKIEKDNFRKNLQKNADSLGIKDDVLDLKSSLSMGNSVLIITDDSTRNEIRNSFKKDDFNSLILELSEDLSENDFYEDIINSELIIDDDIIELNNLVKKHEKYSKILDLINGEYSKLNISPKKIKNQKDNLLQQINDLNITNYNCDIENVLSYDEKMLNKMEEQIKEISLIGEDIFNLQNHFSLDYLESDEFNNLIKISSSIKGHLDYFELQNKKLNDNYEIKIFDNLFSVNKVANISILDKNPIYIEKEDFNTLNEYIKDYPYFDNDKYDLNKYFEADEDIIDSIDINIRYTELIEDEIISNGSQELILEDYDDAITLSKKLVNVSNFILKEIRDIINFYNEFDFLKIDSNLLNINSDFDDYKELISTFKEDIHELVDFRQNYISFNILNDDAQNLIRFSYDNEFEENEISLIFWFNIYNSLLNSFLDDYNCIDVNKIYEEYESEFNEIEKNLLCDNEKLLIQHMYSESLELNKNALIQKEKLIKNYSEGKLDTIKNSLSFYKDFIVANKRIYMMDMDLVSQFLDDSYENHFDYVIITEDFDYGLDRLTLLLRSKNKLIKL